MQIRLNSNVKHSKQVYPAGEVLDSNDMGLDDVQLQALLDCGSAEPFIPRAEAETTAEVADLNAALAAAQAANAELRRELSSLRAQVSIAKPLADPADPYRAKAARKKPADEPAN